MRKLRGAWVGIDQGNEDLFSEFESGGTMWTGSGDRERRRHISFAEPFASPPNVQVVLSLWDIDNGGNIRADLGAENVSETGFDMVFRTWSDTRVARVRLSWMAIGEVRGEDDWLID
ncbi:H-type lectin domain-containing protein [Salipiger mangrovisoli]|uniref:H-type lectin domain-containing protein n=1 Tax=Salipiger mangrovisoli TaxID=2865933 RepID=A0ABR9X2P8_9RHOB|nr:H-type lectin domain-containing protein [Salipiger mangrovisoli]MBE9637747.1 H-type lectin domain-containing protein [Salipiger mangrovisoli]